MNYKKSLFLAVICLISVCVFANFVFAADESQATRNGLLQQLINILLRGGRAEVVSSPSITVISPNGGETFYFDKPINVSWTSNGLNEASIYLRFPDGGVCFLKTVPASQNSTSVSISSGYACPNLPINITAGQYKMQIFGDVGPISGDSSDNYFTLAKPTVNVKIISPKAGDVLVEGNTYNVQWETNSSENIKVLEVRKVGDTGDAGGATYGASAIMKGYPVVSLAAVSYPIDLGVSELRTGKMQYRIHMVTDSGEFYSDIFYITDPASTSCSTVDGFGMTDLVSNNLPNSIEFYTQATCPGNGVYGYPIPTGYKLESCSTGYSPSEHCGCSSCIMAKVKLSKSTTSTNLNLTFPTQGATLVKGTTYTITWTGTDSGINNFYTVYLVGGGLKIDTYLGITNGTQQSFTWTVPSSLSNANNYSIKLSGNKATNSITTNTTFSIADNTNSVNTNNGTDLGLIKIDKPLSQMSRDELIRVLIMLLQALLQK